MGKAQRRRVKRSGLDWDSQVTVIARDHAGAVTTVAITTSLYLAAGIIHKARIRPHSEIAGYEAIDRDTGETWSFDELFGGGFMDDYLTREEIMRRLTRAHARG